jgi:3-deoxy-D-manno-octulosonate 8-phosphate phosphatase KdsC-like HAD superfamily phosphatase
LSFCPNDASEYIKKIVDVPLRTIGGKGAAREMIEYILQKDGTEEELLKLWQ